MIISPQRLKASELFGVMIRKDAFLDSFFVSK